MYSSSFHVVWKERRLYNVEIHNKKHFWMILGNQSIKGPVSDYVLSYILLMVDLSWNSTITEHQLLILASEGQLSQVYTKNDTGLQFVYLSSVVELLF